MPYNPYGAYMPTYQSPYNIGYMAQQNMMQQPTQQQPNISRAGFTDVMYATEKEAEAYKVLPNNKVIFLLNDEQKMVIKSSDMIGLTTTEVYAITPINNLSKNDEKTQDKPNNAVKSDVSKPYMTSDMVENKIADLRNDINKQLESIKDLIANKAEKSNVQEEK